MLSVKADIKKPEGAEKVNTGLIIEGIVLGPSETLDSNLAGYVLKLQSSPLIAKASIQTKKPEKRSGKDTLHFSVVASLN